MTATVSLKPKMMSRVLEATPTDPKVANAHFQSRLAFETDPSDVYSDIQNGETGFVVVDARTREAYMKGACSQGGQSALQRDYPSFYSLPG